LTHLDRIPRLRRVHGQVQVTLARQRLGVGRIAVIAGDREVEGVFRVDGGVIDIDAHMVAPQPRVRGFGQQHLVRRRQHVQRCTGRRFAVGDPHHQGRATAVQEVLRDRIAGLAAIVQAAVDTLKIGRPEDLDGLVRRPFAEEIDERGNRGAHAGDRVCTPLDTSWM
jgi:hypothetical protein